MDSMLARAGVDDEGKELSGPTQVTILHVCVECMAQTQVPLACVLTHFLNQSIMFCTQHTQF